MIVLVLLGVIVLSAVGVVGWLLYSLKSEATEKEASAAVPITNIHEIKAGFAASDEDVSLRDTLAGEKSYSSPFLPEDNGIGNNKVAATQTGQAPAQIRGTGVSSTGVPSQAKDTAAAEEISQLKEEVRLIREKAVVQARNALEVINKLREENERFRSEIEQARLAVKSPEAPDPQLPSLREENAALKTRLETAVAEANNLNDQLAITKREFGEGLAKANETIARLEAEKAGLISSRGESPAPEAMADKIRAEFEKEAAALREEGEALRRENQSLRDEAQKFSAEQTSTATAPVVQTTGNDGEVENFRIERDNLAKRIHELEETNSFQEEKNRFLQYELTKSRAQAAGLERVCENAKKRFEDMAREVRETEQDNASLKRQTEALERSLTDFKKLNVELLKHEKLTQFELEKNRSQIQDLEKIYEGFRSRLEKLDMAEQAPLGGGEDGATAN